MQKRLEGLTEAELEALLEQVEEEKRRLASGEKVNWSCKFLYIKVNLIMLWKMGLSKHYQVVYDDNTTLWS